MSTTHRARYVFTVKESGEGKPWIAFEPLRKDIDALNNVLLGFDLPEGTTYQKASEVAKYLNENISELHYTEL